jgi:WD40 repeat protein
MLKGTKPAKNEMYSIDISPNGKYIITADHKAKVFLYDYETFKELDSFQTSFQ